MTLRAVTTDAPDSPHRARVEAIVAEMLAANPHVVLIAWESAGGRVDVRTVPDATAARIGMADLIYDLAHPIDE